MKCTITVRIGRDTIDPQGLASDAENARVEKGILDAVRTEWPDATVRAVGVDGRTSGIDANGVDITDDVLRLVEEAFMAAF